MVQLSAAGMIGVRKKDFDQICKSLLAGQLQGALAGDLLRRATLSSEGDLPLLLAAPDMSACFPHLLLSLKN